MNLIVLENTTHANNIKNTKTHIRLMNLVKKTTHNSCFDIAGI
jgi:hypothetical protein